MPSEKLEIQVEALDSGEVPGFMVKVFLGNTQISVQRSVTSIYKLDSQLRKIFPNSKFPDLLLPSRAEDVSKRRSSMPGRRSSVGHDSPPKLPVDATSIVTEINDYVQVLLQLPEILTSNIFRSFLDEESVDGATMDLENSDVLSSGVDVLLSGEKNEMTKKTVLKCHTVTFSVKAGDVAVWKFYTKKHDIGFSVDVEGVEVIKYERVNSHEKTICGLFEVPKEVTQRKQPQEGLGITKGEMKIFFDNSYSKLRAKDLRYACGVHSKAELEAAQDQANKINETKKRYIKQRILVQEGLQQLVKSITGQAHLRNGSGHGLTDLLAAQVREEEREELEKILKEKTSLVEAYEETLLVLQEEKKTAAAALQQVEGLQQAKEQLEDELLQASAEIELFKERAESVQTHLQSNQEALMEALGHSKSSEEVEMMLTRALETREKELEEVRGDLDELKLAHKNMEEALAKTTAERKQLKQYGKTAKAEIERLKSENTMLMKEVSSTENDLSFAKDQLADAHAELLRLQSAEVQRGEELNELRSALENAESNAALNTSYSSNGGSRQRASLLELVGEVMRNDNDSRDDAQEEAENDDGSEEDGGGWNIGSGTGQLNESAGIESTPPEGGEKSPYETSLSQDAPQETGLRSFKDGKWTYIPPPPLVDVSTGNFFGF